MPVQIEVRAEEKAAVAERDPPHVRRREDLRHGVAGRTVETALMVPSALTPRICVSSARFTCG